MIIKSFEDYLKSEYLATNIIGESKDINIHKNGYNIVLVTNRESDYEKFKNSCEKFKVNLIQIKDVSDISYSLNLDGSLSINGVGVFTKNNTVFIFRYVRVQNESGKIFKKFLGENGFVVSNTVWTCNTCVNKIRTFKALEKCGVDTIDTVEVTEEIYQSKDLKDISKMQNFLTEHGLNIPVVVKITNGTEGLGIFKCEDINILTSIVQYIIRREGKCLIQPFCKIDSDVRIHVLCKTLYPKTAKLDDFVIVGAMKRESVVGDFRTNFSLGGQITNYKPTNDEKLLAKKAAKALGAVWCGVDICFDSITNKNYVIEVNHNPSLDGISQVVKTPVTDKIVENIKETLSHEKKNEDIDDREVVSYRETVYLDGIPVMGCFDTGNASTCSIKTNHFVKDGDELEFTFCGKKMKKKIIATNSPMHGGMRTEDRPVVLFDLEFNGKKIKDVKVSVRHATKLENNKTNLNRVLISTHIINDLNLMVHPDRTNIFTKTEKPDKMKK